jgi:hypothetical protein
MFQLHDVIVRSYDDNVHVFTKWHAPYTRRIADETAFIAVMAVLLLQFV